MLEEDALLLFKLWDKLRNYTTDYCDNKTMDSFKISFEEARALCNFVSGYLRLE